MMVCTTQSIDEHKLALTRIERSRRPQCNSEQKDKCIREKDTSQVLNWRFYERLHQNSSFNVNSGEATPRCCASRKDFEEKKNAHVFHWLFSLLRLNFHLLFTSDMRLFPFFVNLSQKASILESPCRYHLKCQFGTCEAYVSQTSVAGVFFLSCLVIIKARLCCSIERIIHC